MKRIYLIISLFLYSFQAVHAMEKFKKIRKSIVSSLSKKQPKPPLIITKESRIKDSGQACVQAIKDNKPEDLELELLLKADVNYICDKKSLFYIACEERDTKYTDTKILKILLTHENIDLNSRNAHKSTPLHVACQFGLTKTVTFMLKKSPQALYYKNKNGCIPLHIAVVNKKKDCSELLLCHDINIINHQDYSGNTPLHLACMSAPSDLITLLIEKGAHTTIQNHKQQTPLHLLFSALDANYCQEFLNNCDPEVRHQLMYATDHNNNTQLHLCATMPTEGLDELTIHQYFLQFLVSQNIDPAAQNSYGKTALDLARKAHKELYTLYQIEQLPYIQQALHNQENILIHFLRHADPSPEIHMPIKQQKSHTDTTQKPTLFNITQYKDLSEAQKKCLKGVEENDLSLVKEGLSEGADINFCNQKGSPLLSQACTIAKKSIIKELLAHPTINLTATNIHTGDTALHAACKAPYSDRCGRDAIVALLLQKDPTLATIASMDGTTPLDIAMALEDTNCLKNILQYNPEVANTINKQNETPLYIAVEKNDSKQIELLLTANNKGINHQNNKGDTVLHHACSCTSYSKEICDLVKLLIIHGADTTIKNHNQETALIKLFSDISAPEFKIVDFLLAEHPDIFETLIHTKDKDLNTQFHLCTQLQFFNDNFEQYLSLLKFHKLDIHTKNKDGKKAVDLAGELYNTLYNRYTAQRLPYFKCAFDKQERIYHTFLRAVALPTRCANFKHIFEPQTTGFPEFPRELIQHIMRAYHDLNIETIVAKKYKDNAGYYGDFIENKQEIRKQLLAKPEPKLLWNA